MSFNVNVAIDTGGESLTSIGPSMDVTYNLSPMFCLALEKHGCEGGLRDLDGERCETAEGVIDAALVAMKANPALFKALDPPNGWGDYDGAVEFLNKLRERCLEHPKATVLVRCCG